MIVFLTIIYSAGLVLLGFFLMNKYDRFLNRIIENPGDSDDDKL
ncbi:MAG: hypothetical protein VZR54_08190 [Ruminococcus sp.]|nr:hypothetical protein [Ruminococcus sp.]